MQEQISQPEEVHVHVNDVSPVASQPEQAELPKNESQSHKEGKTPEPVVVVHEQAELPQKSHEEKQQEKTSESVVIVQELPEAKQQDKPPASVVVVQEQAESPQKGTEEKQQEKTPEPIGEDASLASLRCVSDFPPDQFGPNLVDELKFARPEWWVYYKDLALSTYSLYTTVVVMYLACLTSLSPDNIQTKFEAFCTGYAIFYPLISMMFLLTTSMELMLRKYLYYRLLDNGLLMDWKDRDWKRSYYSGFFVFSTVIVIIAAKNATATILIVILQTSLLVIFVMKLYDAESELVTFNKFFQSDYRRTLHLLNEKVLFVDESVVRRDVLAIYYKRESLAAQVKAGLITQEQVDERWFFDFKRLGRLDYPLPQPPSSLFGRLGYFLAKTLWCTTAVEHPSSFAEEQDRKFLGRLLGARLLSFCSVCALEIYGFYKLGQS